ncbi:unnamed protein product [Prorocentrum cordatum]|uniref:Palmitoyltransferase n=1 Tax=Prorocentrum cordatum TaxID=2364126 RepID=A0ABN9VNM6_9DINO|nr:unnamed protein product [Polarella glacialis]
MRQRPPACLDLATLRPLAPRTEGRSCQGSLLRVPERSLPRWCWACQGPKPARAHHCRVCGRCVLKMDHHCPWVNNCVGAHNYRYFCLFLLYLAQGCLFVLVVFPYGFTTWGFWGSAAEDDAVVRSFHPAMVPAAVAARLPGWRWLEAFSPLALMVPAGWVAAAIGLLSMCGMGGCHAFLVLTNQTTIEFYANGDDRWRAWVEWRSWRSPHDLGPAANFRSVFGPS